MLTRQELKRHAKEQIKGNIGLCFICFLIFAAISLVLGAIPVLNFVTIWGLILVISPLILGLTKVYLEISHERRPDVSTFFSGFDQFGQSLVVYLLLCIPSFIMATLVASPLLVMLITDNYDGLALYCIWSAFIVLADYCIMLGFSMIYYIMAEQPELSAIDVFKASWQMMKGWKWDFFLFQLSFFFWFLLGTLTFGIAYIYVVPYIGVATANYYHNIKKNQNIFDPNPKEDNSAKAGGEIFPVIQAETVMETATTIEEAPLDKTDNLAEETLSDEVTQTIEVSHDKDTETLAAPLIDEAEEPPVSEADEAMAKFPAAEVETVPEDKKEAPDPACEENGNPETEEEDEEWSWDKMLK